MVIAKTLEIEQNFKQTLKHWKIPNLDQNPHKKRNVIWLSRNLVNNHLSFHIQRIVWMLYKIRTWCLVCTVKLYKNLKLEKIIIWTLLSVFAIMFDGCLWLTSSWKILSSLNVINGREGKFLCPAPTYHTCYCGTNISDNVIRFAHFSHSGYISILRNISQ